MAEEEIAEVISRLTLVFSVRQFAEESVTRLQRFSVMAERNNNMQMMAGIAEAVDALSSLVAVCDRQIPGANRKEKQGEQNGKTQSGDNRAGSE